MRILGNKIAFSAQQLYTKIGFRGFVVQEKKSVQDLGNKKKRTTKKKEKKLIATKSGLVGMKEYPKTYNHVKYFLPYTLSRSLNENAFYTKLLKRHVTY